MNCYHSTRKPEEPFFFNAWTMATMLADVLANLEPTPTCCSSIEASWTR